MAERGRIRENNAMWDAYFASRDGADLEVWYEDLASDPFHQINRIAEFLGHPGNVFNREPESNLRRMSDDLTEEWMECLRKEKGDPKG